MTRRDEINGLFLIQDFPYVRVTPENYRVIFRQAKPNCFLLYEAAWQSGFTVNGIEP